ncbi:sugar phosphate permease [Actinomycetospora succinea]|uniref:Sugar phosphate permease n=1 Tax=Actinomycetospora succinea TaxID=663603 RepID=A0A4R6UWS2_9PSEU|nr:MFS transporter [Actinomycetospora succinea]TDQ51782.1 sugar phosphate permease [Actinomycetospora succinea]
MRSRRRWAVLAAGVAAQTAASAMVYGVPFLVPSLRDERGLSLAAVGIVVAAPTLGLLMALIAWGAVVDRVGERLPMAVGLGACGAVTGVLALLAPPSLTTTVALLVFAGVGAASVNAASGRLIMGWFDVDERGLAMGIRQTAQPLGVAFAGLVLPTLAAREGPLPALGWPALACLVCAVVVVLVAADPPRVPRAPGEAPPASPYRSPVLPRVHAASALLVLPQFAVSAFSLEYLVREQGWSPGVAGVFVAGAQIAGAGGRIASGWWSDRVGSRLRPMRQLAVASAAVLLVFALGDLTLGLIAVAGIAAGSVITVADNGLAFTATAEIAGSSWSGRALGVQNTTQNIVATIAPPALGALIGVSSYAVGFAVVALAPLAAIGVTPVASEPEPERVTAARAAAGPGD